LGLFGIITCKDCVEVLRAYLDGEMTPEDQAHLKGHLEDCPPCEEFLNTYRDTPDLCRKALASRMPEELSRKLKDFLRAKVAKSEA
jgi:anti-sigma factor (TIGR02949 family)